MLRKIYKEEYQRAYEKEKKQALTKEIDAIKKRAREDK